MIRKLEHKDKDEFIRMQLEFYSSEAVLHEVPVSYHERTFSEAVKGSPYIDAFIILDGEDYVGYSITAKTYSGEVGGMAVWLEELYIREGYRGKGIGSEFIEYAFKFYADYARVRLEVEHDNEGAIKLYEKLGFYELPYMQMVKDKVKLL